MFQLISVSCGAQGLNLTVANRAIVLDHWWHKCLEQQAFGRIHRIGQTKEVHTAKIVVAGSMDEDILHVQVTKEASIASAVRRKDPVYDDILDMLDGDNQFGEELAGVADLSNDDSSSDASSESGDETDGGSSSSDHDDDDDHEGYDTEVRADDSDAEYKPVSCRGGGGGPSRDGSGEEGSDEDLD